MAKPLTLAQVIEKNKVYSSVAYVTLIEIAVRMPNSETVVETLRITENTEEIVFEGNTYTPFPFELDLKSELGEEPVITLSIKDVLGGIRQRMVSYFGGVGFAMRVIVLSVGSTMPEIEEFFRVVGSGTDDYSITFQLGAAQHLSIAFPRRRQGKHVCSWIYKSAQCGYLASMTGGTDMPTCSRTLHGADGCQAHNNQNRFGGFPNISQ